MIKKILLGTLIVILTLVIAGFAFIWQVGAWNILFPSTHHDSLAPQLPTALDSPSVLVFSKTNQFRHKDGIAGGLIALKEIADELKFSVFATENGAIFNTDDLQRFDVVVFLNSTGDMLNAAQETAFKNWLEAGGGWLGIHAAGDGSHVGWAWYMDNLIGADFTAHILGPQFQTATVVTEAVQHVTNLNMPPRWEAEEEWYSWASSPRQKGFRIIATVDESSYSPVQNLFGTATDLSMGDHPIAWSNCVGGGKSFYTALGHAAAAYDNEQFRRQLSNALIWLTEDSLCESMTFALTP